MQPLTKRQREILCLSSVGISIKEIADVLDSTFNAISQHRIKTMLKLGARNTTHAVVIAIREGIIPMPDEDTNRRDFDDEDFDDFRTSDCGDDGRLRA